MCSCQLASGEVVCRSVDGRLRGPHSWVGAHSAAAGSTARCRGASTYRVTNREPPWTMASIFAIVQARDFRFAFPQHNDITLAHAGCALSLAEDILGQCGESLLCAGGRSRFWAVVPSKRGRQEEGPIDLRSTPEP